MQNYNLYAKSHNAAKHFHAVQRNNSMASLCCLRMPDKVTFCFLFRSLDLRRNLPQKLLCAQQKSKPVLAVTGNTEGQREKSTCYVTFSQIRNFFWAQHLCISFLFLGLYLIFQQPIFDYFELGKQSFVESHLGSEYSSKRFVRKIL